MSQPTPLDEAAFAWLQAKQDEAAARDRRLAIEEFIVAKMGAKEEGTTKIDTDWYTLKTEGNLTRALTDDFAAKMDGMPPEVFNQIVKWKPSLDVRALKSLATTNPEAYRLACAGIETKPAKVGVKVEAREQVEEAA